jgi:hypothetical protein
MESHVFAFASSPFVPIAIGFFGLGTGYLVWGGRALFDLPKRAPKSTKLWAYGVSGCQA